MSEERASRHKAEVFTDDERWRSADLCHTPALEFVIGLFQSVWYVRLKFFIFLGTPNKKKLRVPAAGKSDLLALCRLPSFDP